MHDFGLVHKPVDEQHVQEGAIQIADLRHTHAKLPGRIVDPGCEFAAHTPDFLRLRRICLLAALLGQIEQLTTQLNRLLEFMMRPRRRRRRWRPLGNIAPRVKHFYRARRFTDLLAFQATHVEQWQVHRCGRLMKMEVQEAVFRVLPVDGKLSTIRLCAIVKGERAQQQVLLTMCCGVNRLPHETKINRSVVPRHD